MGEEDQQITGTGHGCSQRLGLIQPDRLIILGLIILALWLIYTPLYVQSWHFKTNAAWIPLQFWFHSFLCHRLCMSPQDGFFGHCNTRGIVLGLPRQSWVNFYTRASASGTYWGDLWERRGSLWRKKQPVQSCRRAGGKARRGTVMSLGFQQGPSGNFHFICTVPV